MKRFLVCTVAALAVLSLGLVLNHCGGSGDEKQCETNEECPEGYWCDRTVWECKKINCIPNCSGKCCGEDDCGGTCLDNCSTGYECNPDKCVCETTGCQTDADCNKTQCCIGNPKTCTDMSCGALECGPDPVCGKECGPCPVPEVCNDNGMCEVTGCQTDADCNETQCCIGNPKTCTDMSCGALECGPDPVCGKECGPCPAGEICNDDGVCEVTGCQTDADCNETQCCIGNPKTCTDMSCGAIECGPDPVCGKECGPCPVPEVCNDNGMCEVTGCQTDADCNETQCCIGNPKTCTDMSCGALECGPDPVCGKECGPCPAGEICNDDGVCEVTGCQTDADCNETQCCIGNPKTCTDMSCGALECGPDPVCGKECGPCPAGEICNDDGVCEVTGCQTNADCNETQCCIGNPKTCTDMSCGALECGPDPVCGKECGPCPAGEICNDDGVCEIGTAGSCPAGQECVQVGASGAMGCVIPPDTIPDTNQTDCAESGCDGNYACYCQDQDCDASICIEMCGECPASLNCCELWPGGPMGCLTADCTGFPADPPACSESTPCQGNAACYCVGGNCDDAICIDNCSVDHDPCQNGDTRCSGDTVQTCTGGAWADTTDCSTSDAVCKDGACVTPAGLGEFCEDLACETGLDCIGFQGDTHSFCTPQCDCEDWTGCDTDAGWECMFSDQAPVDPTCWCGKTCPNNDPATDCPNGGTGWTCEETEPGSGMYVCMIQ